MTTTHYPTAESESLDSDPAPLSRLAPADFVLGQESDEHLDALRAAGEAHLWPGPYKTGDLSSEHGLKLAVGGMGPWVLDADGRTWFDSLSGMWLTNVGHG
jgi:hypothetical protein